MTKKSFDIFVIVVSLLAIALYFLLSEGHKNFPLFITIAVGSIPLLWEIAKKILKKDLGADVLAAIALVTAVIVGQYLAAVLIILMLAGGQALEEYAMRKASSVLSALAERMPSIAHRKNGEKIEEIAITDIKIGDSIVVLPHETCPVDGVVVEGRGNMDEAYLTGEPYKVSKAVGSSVLSGAINGESMLIVRAEKLPEDSRYASIMKVMQEAEEKRPNLRRLGDQIGAIFAPISLAIALLAWAVTGDSVRFLAVLVVATPCTLLIAIPITIISAISMAAKRGIIIKDPTVLERLPTCKTAIFDKTGTLTYGRPELTEIITASDISKDKILQQVASLERYSKHPLAHAILQAAEKNKLILLPAESLSEKAGMGLIGVVDGIEIIITSRKNLEKNYPDIFINLPKAGEGLECVVLTKNSPLPLEEGQGEGVAACLELSTPSPPALSQRERELKFAATLTFRDTPREDGESFICHLAPAHQFTKTMIVSGDRESEVAYLAQQMCISDILASQTPEQKLAVVREEAAKAPTLFMGD